MANVVKMDEDKIKAIEKCAVIHRLTGEVQCGFCKKWFDDILAHLFSDAHTGPNTTHMDYNTNIYRRFAKKVELWKK